MYLESKKGSRCMTYPIKMHWFRTVQIEKPIQKVISGLEYLKVFHFDQILQIVLGLFQFGYPRIVFSNRTLHCVYSFNLLEDRRYIIYVNYTLFVVSTPLYSYDLHGDRGSGTVKVYFPGTVNVCLPNIYRFGF